jgi:peptidoglycan/xylan/chitin deacetylase (PgdA/CDA1 family)
MKKERTSAIPVVMYHSVGRVIDDWHWSFLTTPWKVFEDHLRWLAKSGYKTVSLDDLIAHQTGERKLGKRSVVLTFDDGYIDNWTYVAPLLKKYSFCGTIFVNPEFVDPRGVIRPVLGEKFKGMKMTDDTVENRGFMSWSELKLSEEQGVFDVQSHAMSHTWYEISDKIVDFHRPGDGYYWLDWNQFPAKKPFYLQQPQLSDVPWGIPVYEHGKSLQVKRFFPDRREIEQLAEMVKNNGEDQFFQNPRWREELSAAAEKIRMKVDGTGKLETEKAFLKRVSYELAESKQIIENRLMKKVDYLCWPGGGYDENTRDIALSLYRAVTRSSSDPMQHFNRIGDNDRFISRIGVPSLECNGRIHYPGGCYLVRSLREFQGSLFERRWRQVLKLKELFQVKAAI